MSLPVILRGEAEADIREIYDYLERVRAGLGDQFVASRSRTYTPLFLKMMCERHDSSDSSMLPITQHSPIELRSWL